MRATDTAGNVDPTPASASWQVVSAPPNDMFASAQGIGSWSGTVSGTTVLATKEPGEPKHNGNADGHSVWYVWTPPASGSVTFSTSGSGFGTELAVYTGATLSQLERVASGTTKVTFSARALLVYRIAVDGANGASGALALSWHQ